MVGPEPLPIPVTSRTRTRLWRAVVTIVVLLAATVGPISGAGPAAAGARQQTRPPASQLQQLLDQIVVAGAPGAIGLVWDGTTTERAASGVADLRTGRPMRTADHFRVGSITKTFVATVVLQLVGEHVLRLSDPVERWLPGLVPDGAHITVENLLNHTSGLYNYTDDPRILAPYLDRGDRDFVWRPRQLVRVATSHAPLFAPGTGWSYSNTGYILLGLIVQASTGVDIKRQLERRIFRPLRLHDTSFPVTDPRVPQPNAHGYANAHPGAALTDTTVFSPSWAWAAGAIVSTVDDLARFYRALLGDRLLRPDLLAAMKTTVDAGAGFRYGLGLVQADAPCATIWGHNGDFIGYFDFAITSDAVDRQVVLMMNLDDEVNVPPAVDESFTTALLGSFCPS
jgi:D-alanyl-D-alanine carboxypeptidase